MSGARKEDDSGSGEINDFAGDGDKGGGRRLQSESAGRGTIVVVDGNSREVQCHQSSPLVLVETDLVVVLTEILQ